MREFVCVCVGGCERESKCICECLCHNVTADTLLII